MAEQTSTTTFGAKALGGILAVAEAMGELPVAGVTTEGQIFRVSAAEVNLDSGRVNLRLEALPEEGAA